MRGVESDADAGTQIEGQTIHRERHGKGLDETLRDEISPSIRFALEEDDRELIAAEAGNHVEGAGHAHKALCDVLEQAITGRVSQCVVNLLESVEIQDKQDGFVLCPDYCIKTLTEDQAVGQVGEMVAMRQPIQALLVGTPAGEIADDGAKARGPLVPPHR